MKIRVGMRKNSESMSRVDYLRWVAGVTSPRTGRVASTTSPLIAHPAYLPLLENDRNKHRYEYEQSEEGDQILLFIDLPQSIRAPLGSSNRIRVLLLPQAVAGKLQQ
jgi:hypothetical protein